MLKLGDMIRLLIAIGFASVCGLGSLKLAEKEIAGAAVDAYKYGGYVSVRGFHQRLTNGR